MALTEGDYWVFVEVESKHYLSKAHVHQNKRNKKWYATVFRKEWWLPRVDEPQFKYVSRIYRNYKGEGVRVTVYTRYHSNLVALPYIEPSTRFRDEQYQEPDGTTSPSNREPEGQGR